MSASLLARLTDLLGPPHVETGADALALAGSDLSWQDGPPLLAMIAPASSAETAAAVRLIGDAGHACIARGGGMSYTGGCVARRAGTVMIDMRRMDRIINVNGADMHVTVECGCTWQTLYETLKARGLRTPFFGPLSGKYATVGGALAQNAFFMGSGLYGTAADNCLGIEVVLADGSVVQTGSAAQHGGRPFFRHAGPDLTGIFTSDAGAFGIKTRATFRLIGIPAATVCTSWSFDSADAMLAAQTTLARRQLAAECFGFNPAYHRALARRALTLREAWREARALFGASGGALAGAARVLRLALGGRAAIDKARYSLHVIVEGASNAAVSAAARQVRTVCAPAARRMSNALPLAFRATPFRGMRNLMLGPQGQIWIPVHGVFPLSDAQAVIAATEQFFERHAALMAEHGISSSYLSFCPGMLFVVEPSLYWNDALGPFRLGLIEPEYQQRWHALPPRPQARAVALRLRAQLRALYGSMGACHLQLGKYYPLQSSLKNGATWDLLEHLKNLLDPHGTLNPGALGLGSAVPQPAPGRTQ